MSLRTRAIMASTSFVLWSVSGWLWAGATTDGSVGRVTSLAGRFEVPETLGTVRGGNLFHSFQNFNIARGEVATFTTTTASLSNVLARVTGGSVSNIDGTLRLLAENGAKPNFYLVNPAGVTFGGGAAIDVPAAFHVSTAHKVIFSDGMEWPTHTPSTNSLTAATPSAFGFLGELPAADIVFSNRAPDGSIPSSDGASASRLQIVTGNGELFDVVGGNLKFTDTRIIQRVDNGEIRIVAAGGGGLRIPVTGEVIDNPLGNLSMENSEIMAFPRLAPSQIVVNAGSVNLISSDIATVNYADWSGGGVTVRASGDIVLSGNSEIASVAAGSGKAPNVVVEAKNVTVDNRIPVDQAFMGIYSLVDNAAGDSGNVEIRARGDINLLGGGAFVGSITNASGKAGDVGVVASNLIIDTQGGASKHPTGIYSETTGSGGAGSATINVRDALVLRNRGLISATTSAEGAAGRIVINAGSMLVDGLGSTSTAVTGVTTQANLNSSGDAGSVSIHVSGQLLLRQGGVIESNTLGRGAAGAVAVDAGTIQIDGSGADKFTGISSSATDYSSGQTGTVEVNARSSLTLTNNSRLSIKNLALVSSPEGLETTRLSIIAPEIRLGSQASITAASTQNTHASAVSVKAERLLLSNGATITTTAVDGNGGPIDLAVGRAMLLDNAQVTTSVTGNNGNGGDIRIVSPNLALNTGFVQANTVAPRASGGKVEIAAERLLASGNSLFVQSGQVIRQFQVGRFGDNVIEAIAPDGVNGTVTLARPAIDLVGSILPLSASLMDLSSLLSAACDRVPGSSLSVLPRASTVRAGMLRVGGDR